jgi:hypothetical protein
MAQRMEGHLLRGFRVGVGGGGGRRKREEEARGGGREGEGEGVEGGVAQHGHPRKRSSLASVGPSV